MFDVSRYDCTQFDNATRVEHVRLESFIKRITAYTDIFSVMYPDTPTRILFIDTKFRVVIDG